MGATKTLLTAEQFDNYPFEEDKRYELDEGELIEMTRPAYKHNRVLKNLLFELETYFRKNGLGEALLSENLYALSANTRRSPDVAVILGDRHEELKNAKVIPIIPEIAAEVLSPSERTAPGALGATEESSRPAALCANLATETPRVIHRKLKQYFEAGVKEVWLIDPDSREVDVWRGATLPDRALVAGEALMSPLLPGFELPLAELFS
jgi:Uma2 family endonuclease